MRLESFFQKRLCVATSGGVDSTALLHYLKTLEKKCGFVLSAVHCEHGIRGEESKEDMRFVQKLCEHYGVVCYTFEEDCIEKAKKEKLSLETAARAFRRSCFETLVKSGQVDYIVTAHHKGDEAETVLFRLARGSALAGASAIKETDGYYLRPFLSWSKREILEYAKANGLSHREDRTNYELDATRNVIRLQVLPALEKAVPNAAENLARFAMLAEQDDGYLYSLSEQLVFATENGIRVQFSEIFPLFSRACVSAMKRLGVEKDYTKSHIDGLYALQKAERGSLLDLPFGVQAKRDFESILFYKKSEKEVVFKPSERVEIFSKNGFDGGRYAVKVSDTLPIEQNGPFKILRVDGDKIPKSAVFRFRKEGDEIEKFGGGTQTLKKFFNEKKIPTEERAHLPLIAEQDSKTVYAVCGVEISNRLKITEETSNSFYIILKKK